MEEAERQIKIIHTENLTAFSILALNSENRFQEVKQQLPWIEPSINMLHLEAVRSFVFGASLASIGCAAYLLEHSLRMAIWDNHNSGSRRKKPSKGIFDETLGKLINSDKYQGRLEKLIPDSNDREWWKAVTNAVRNKVNHVDFPAIFRIAKELSLEYDYAYSGLEGPNSWNPENPHSWGMFWHRFGDKLAGDFLTQVTRQVMKLVHNTEWEPDESCWISQKYEYERFFKEDWKFEALKKSINRVYDK